MTVRRCAFAALAILFAFAATAHAATVGNVQAAKQQHPYALPQEDPLTPRIYRAKSLTVPPQHFKLSAADAIRIGEQTEAVRAARRKHPDLKPIAYLSPLILRQGHFWHWDIIWNDHGKQIVEVEIGPFGGILQVTKGLDIGWPLLEGLPGVLGRKLNAPYIYIPLCLMFLLPFLDFRRPFRLLHLDLLMLLGFTLSQYFFTRGRASVSVPLIYPFLFYAAIRAGVAGFRPRRRSGPLIPHLSTGFLIAGVAIRVAGRLAFGIFGSEAFDIGRAGAIGADRIEHGLQLYVDNDGHGDTYGPINYLLYVPAELIWPYTPTNGTAPIAATLMFDVMLIAALLVLGRRLRAGPEGTRLGFALAWAWCALPYSALIISGNTNDALVPLFVLLALIVIGSPPLRGAMIGFGTMIKFAPGLLAPLLIVGRGPFRWKPVLIGSAVFIVVCVVTLVPFIPDGGLKEFWNTTLGYQLQRTSPLAIWNRNPGLDFLKPLFLAITVALAISTAFVPRRRSVGQVAALAAAILTSVQITGNYWLYFYVAWFAPLLFVALFEEYSDLGPADQRNVTSDLVKPEMISQPSSVTATRSSIRTPSTPGR